MSPTLALTHGLTADLQAIVEQLHRHGRDAESANVAYALAHRLRRGEPFVTLRYRTRVREVALASGVVDAALAAECADLYAADFAGAVLVDREGVVGELERQGAEWWEGLA